MAGWDIDAGYLGPARLAAALRSGRAGTGTEGEIASLARLEAEHQLRGAPAAPAGPLPSPTPAADLPAADQLQLLAGEAPGRIPLPPSAQVLWAQHKYSVMARDPARGKAIGKQVARLPRGPAPAALLDELVALLRLPAPPGRARNALMHMWGYVSDGVTAEERAGFAQEMARHPRAALLRIGTLAQEQQRTYLLHSTALGELLATLPEGPPAA